MLTRSLYVVATTILVGGLTYAVVITPRPCGMDDILTSCGSGARSAIALGTVAVSLILFYVGRALSGDRP